MNINFRQIISSIILLSVAVIAFVIMAPVVIFLIIFLAIFSFFVRRRVMKANPEFFNQFKNQKGRVIDQEEDGNYNSSNNYTDQIK